MSCDTSAFSNRSFTDGSTFSLYPTVFASKTNQIHHTVDFSFDCVTQHVSHVYDILLSKTTGHEGKPVFGFVIKIDWHTAKPIVVPDPSSLIFQGESSFRTDHRDPRYRSPRLSNRRSLRLFGSRSSGASSERAIETESEPKESTVLWIAHRSRRSLLLLSVRIFPHSLPHSSCLRLSLPSSLRGPSAALSCLYSPYLSPDLSIRLSSPPRRSSLFIAPPHCAANSL